MNYKSISKIISGTLLCTMFLYQVPVLAYTKDETVYSKLDANGNKYESIVSTHLKNNENEELIKDITNLLNIKNTNGDETFEQNENSIIWNAEKHDIYYQGETDKELPIEVSVKYKLNGEEIEAKDIIGKSGNVTVSLTYTNKDEHIVNVNGKNEKLYTPFVVVAGTIIDNNNNRNIAITNGKVIDDGSKTVALGIALPGLQESLNIPKDKVEIPNSIEISMDATDFEMNSIMSFVTPKVIEKDDISILDDIEEIYNQVDTLSSSSKQIEEGANTLKEGTLTYSGKMQEFEGAMRKVSEGMTSANSNYTKINEGIKTLNSSSSELNSGAKQVADGIGQIETNLSTVNEKLGEILEGSKSLKSGETEVIKGIDTIITKLDQIPLADNSTKIKELETLVNTNKATITTLENANNKLKIQAGSLTDENEKLTIESQIESNNSIIKLLQANIQAENTTIATLKATDNSSIVELKEGLKQVKAGLNSLSNGTDTLNTGIATLKTGTATLVDKTGELNSGANKLYQGTNKLSSATVTLKTGSDEMKKGLNTLDNSGNQLLQANLQLTEGAATLNEGATSLKEGITTFNTEGIQKICNYINGDIKDITVRVEKLVDLSKEYNNFTMIEDGANGNVKFITIIDALKKQEEQENNKESIIIDSKKEDEKEE